MWQTAKMQLRFAKKFRRLMSWQTGVSVCINRKLTEKQQMHKVDLRRKIKWD